MSLLPPPWFRRHRLLCSVLLAGALLCAGAWFARAPLLTGVAKAWVVDEPVTNADAIVVLGGRPDIRAVEAARLYQRGLAPLILYMQVKLTPTAEMGITASEADITRRVLLSNNVPETAMQAIGNGVTSTYDESCVVRAWVDKTGAKSLVIPTDLFHTRRVRWVFRKQLKGSGAKACLHAVQPKEYAVNDWWKTPEGFLAFQSEVVKSIYYLSRH